jgi:hypothetical protein
VVKASPQLRRRLTERGNMNREIEFTNQRLRQLKARISKLRHYFRHTFKAGADRKIRPLSSYRQSESRLKNVEFPATKSDYGHGEA